MATLLSFDEIQKLHSGSRHIDYDEFFGDMNISEEEASKRKKFAEELEDDIFLILAMMYSLISVEVDEDGKIHVDTTGIDFNDISEKLESLLEENIKPRHDIDDYFGIYYIPKFVDEFIRTTKEHADDPYYWSSDRAQVIGENEANSVFEYIAFDSAISSGKTISVWDCMMDGKERDDHHEADGQVIDIGGLFKVGDSLMRFPRDFMYGAGPEQIVNCRCTASYY